MKPLKYLSALFIAVALASSIGCASTQKQEGTGEYIDDSLITTKVKAAILNEPRLKVAEINVETFKGVVQLSGFVSSRADINKAVEVARSVQGVESVKNDMRLKGQPQIGSSLLWGSWSGIWEAGRDGGAVRGPGHW